MKLVYKCGERRQESSPRCAKLLCECFCFVGGGLGGRFRRVVSKQVEVE